jgi:asparagine synthase (glutamine-hydrolysing)
MCDVLAHRGPDDEGMYLGEGVALGMRRLSIIDVDGGHQPIWNEDSSLCIVFNGEIYNFPELRRQLVSAGHEFSTRTDTEVVLHAFEQWGEGCVRRLNGMFGFAIWDRNRRQLFLARDRLGIKPLHHMLDRGNLLFGSEIKSILAHPTVGRTVDLAALSDYLAYEYVPTPRTIFHGIQKLPPGHTLTWRQRDGSIDVRRYWDRT